MKHLLLATALSVSSSSYALYLQMEGGEGTKEQNHKHCKEKAGLVFKFYTLLEQGYDAYALSQRPSARINRKEWAIARTYWQGHLGDKTEATNNYYENCMLIRSAGMEID
jgi:hypothetical protein